MYDSEWTLRKKLIFLTGMGVSDDCKCAPILYCFLKKTASLDTQSFKIVA